MLMLHIHLNAEIAADLLLQLAQILIGKTEILCLSLHGGRLFAQNPVQLRGCIFRLFHRRRRFALVFLRFLKNLPGAGRRKPVMTEHRVHQFIQTFFFLSVLVHVNALSARLTAGR